MKATEGIWGFIGKRSLGAEHSWVQFQTYCFQHVTLILMNLTSSSAGWICIYRTETKQMSADVFMLSDVKCTTRDAPRGKVHGCFHR